MLGADEQRLLTALRPKPDEELEDLFKSKSGKYKIEVHFGKNRTLWAPNSGLVICWESGKRFHGGGDQQVHWCGYDDCKMPILDIFFGQFSVVCPHCQRENHLDKYTKRDFARMARETGQDKDKISQLPIIFSERLFKLTNSKLADMLVDLFRKLESDCDLYLKFHPMDIRCRDVPEVRKPDIYEKARSKRYARKGTLIYLRDNIHKDLASGADLKGRFLAAITA